MRSRRAARLDAALATTSLVVAACSGSIVAAVPVERFVSTRATIARALPGPMAGVAPSSGLGLLVPGAEAARAVLFELLRALAEDDEAAVRRLVADSVVSIHALRAGVRSTRAPATIVRGETMTQRLFVAYRAARPTSSGLGLPRVVPDLVEVIPVTFLAEGELPEGLDRTDLAVRFPIEGALTRTPLRTVRDEMGLLVVRVGFDGPRIVGM